MTDELGTQVLATVNQMRADLSAHAGGEEDEIRDIKSDIAGIKVDLSEWRFAAEQRHHEAMQASERRHTSLIQSLSAYQDDVNAMRRAFLVDAKGNPRFDDHYDDHNTRDRWYGILGNWLRDGFGNLVKLAMASGAVWFLYQVWEALHKGPK